MEPARPGTSRDSACSASALSKPPVTIADNCKELMKSAKSKYDVRERSQKPSQHSLDEDEEYSFANNHHFETDNKNYYLAEKGPKGYYCQLNGKQTLGENIADNGGLKAAFHAFEDWLGTHPDEPPLPGVNLTHKQLFYVGFAQVWCSTETPEAIHLQILSDPHSPAKYRVTGPVSNSEEFAREFQCRKNSAMNTKKKCEVW
ncbi:hypothetical protein ISCGN_007447 [Ixodes scapularis]